MTRTRRKPKTTSANYLFGTSDLAARRLELLAGVFEKSTRDFLLKAAGGRRWRLALDLACGAGFTTSLIAQTLQCDRVVGLDTSETFLLRAQAAASERVSFAMHDVTAVPFPCGRADTIFCRFLLTHLRDPQAIVARWAGQLNPGGLIMIEETEMIRTAHPVFARYLEIVEAILAKQSNQLYAGVLLGTLAPPGGLKPFMNEVRRVPARNCDAARMFELNMDAWREAEVVRANYRRESLHELERNLGQLAAQRSRDCDIVWEMRQAAFCA